MTVSRKVQIAVTGGMSFAAVDVEAQGIPLQKKGKSFKGERSSVKLDDPIEVFYWVKGGTGAQYEVKTTIGDKSRSTSGAIGSTNHVKRTVKYELADFGLEDHS